MVDSDDWQQEINPEFYPSAMIEGFHLNRNTIIGPGNIYHQKPTRPKGRQKEELVYLLLIYQDYQCAICRTTFDPTSCPYELDHIICLGSTTDRRANNIDNLQLLCPNCHSIKTRFCDPVIIQAMTHLGQVNISRALVEQEIHCFDRLPSA